MLGRTAGLAALAALVAMTIVPASAQTYPNGQVRLIVPTSPGGVTDTMARIVSQRLTLLSTPAIYLIFARMSERRRRRREERRAAMTRGLARVKKAEA